MKFSYLIILLCFSLFVGGCSSANKAEKSRIKRQTAQELYEEARVNLNSHNYRAAISKLETLDNRYPFGPYADQAQLDLIYAYYKNNDNASAISQADRFIRQHPRHTKVDYAYYMKGLVNFTAEVGFVQEVMSAKLDERDAGTARQAFNDFADLVKKFPESQYAADARQRMIYLRNRLASYELHVADYYMERKAYLGAANRAKYVLEHYPKTTENARALLIMMTAYNELGMSELAEKSRRSLIFNYPEYAKKVGL